MRVVLILVLLTAFSGMVFSKTFDNLTPEKRKAFAADWLETGKAYLNSKKPAKAKNCFLYVNDLYPIGPEADEARNLLKSSFNLSLQYDSDKLFLSYIKRAETLTEPAYKINNYRMSQEIKKDPDILLKIAYIYLGQNDKDQAKAYLKQALDAGYPKESVKADLAALLE